MTNPWKDTMTKFLKSFCSDESGQTLAEYALLLALIAVVCIAALLILGKAIFGAFGYVTGELPTV